ncbi:sulfite oxidase, partial [Trichodelitschia bisporula]
MTTYEYTVEEPLNREPPIDELLSSFITKNEYDRNHGPIPHINAATHTVQIDGLVNRKIFFTIDDLRSFPQHEVLAVLQCAGNRRHSMRTLIKEVKGLDWADGAVMNCTWRGPRLRDVLAEAGVADSLVDEKGYKGWVSFACYETPCEDDSWYGGSVPLARAMDEDGDCILALEMNGAPLTPYRGFPVRALIPGIAGARSVKWLNLITLSTTDCANFYQQHDYKILPPEARTWEEAEKYWPTVPAMMDMPVNSVVGLPESGSTVVRAADGTIEARGYAVPAGVCGPVMKAEVTGDGGQTWVEAELDFGGAEKDDLKTVEGRRRLRWAWCLWSARVKVEPGEGRQVFCRAVDWGGNSQDKDGQWNIRGVGFNAWGQVKDLTIV